MSSEHYNVTVTINKVTREPKQPPVRGAVPPANSDERIVEMVVQLACKSDTLPDAVRKTVDHLNVEIQ